MGNFRNQTNARAKASRIGGSTIMLSILLIGIFSTQKNAELNKHEDLTASTTESIVEESAAENFSSNTVDLSEEVVATEKVSLASAPAPKTIASPMSTTSMVQYASMEAVVEENKGKLIWKTMAQRHIKSFEIERSIDDDTYVSLGSIPAEGSGEHMQEKLYEFVDEKLAMVQMPRVYYRIKQIGFDGVDSYSDVMEHDFGLDLGLYARIEEKSSGQINILYAADKSGPITMKIFDVGGQVLEKRDLEADFDPQLLAIDATNLKEGNYFLQLEDGSTSVMEQFQYGK